MEVLLDTNFIISCILKKIDFLSQLRELGFKVVVPKEVLEELKDLKTNRKTSREERGAIEVAFKIFEQDKTKKMGLGKGKVDDELIAKGREGIYIATLDNGIKREIENKVIIHSSKKSVGIERD